MGVQGGDAVVMLDHHIVAIGVVVGGDGHHTAPGGEDGRALGRGDVGAGVVARQAGNGVDAGAEGGGDFIASGDRPLPAGARVEADLPRGDLGLDLLLLFDDLGFDFFLFPLQGVPAGLVLRLLALNLLDQGGGVRLLGIQLLLLCHQRVPLGLLVGPAGLQLGLLRLDALAQGGQIVHDLVVGLHDLTDKGGPVQQVGEVGRVKEDGPVGDRSRLLHGPHPLAEQLVLDFFLGLGILQLGLLIRNEGVVLGNDGLGALNLLDLGGNLPVQQAFLLQGLGLVSGDGFELPVQVLDLGGQVSLLLLVFPDLLLQLRGVGRLGGLQHHGEHGQEHHQGQESR